MWTKQQHATHTTTEPTISPAAPSAASAAARAPVSSAPQSALIGSSLIIKGHVTGSENLQIDGTVEGPISLTGHELIVGSSAQLNSEINAGAVIVYGKVVGNVQARDRVDIKRDGSVVGDISTARISIEDGAHFKGRIEIDPSKSQSSSH